MKAFWVDAVLFFCQLSEMTGVKGSFFEYPRAPGRVL